MHHLLAQLGSHLMIVRDQATTTHPGDRLRRLVAGGARPQAERGRKVEGRKTYAEKEPELVRRARELSEQRPRLSLRQIFAELASQGFTTPPEKAYSASAVASMLDSLAGGAAKGSESKRERRWKRLS